jgi:hypothetical protein
MENRQTLQESSIGRQRLSVALYCMALRAESIRFLAAETMGCDDGSTAWNIPSASHALASALRKSPVCADPSLTFSSAMPEAQITTAQASMSALTYIRMTRVQDTTQE